jgi:hypothetical protein
MLGKEIFATVVSERSSSRKFGRGHNRETGGQQARHDYEALPSSQNSRFGVA